MYIYVEAYLFYFNSFKLFTHQASFLKIINLLHYNIFLDLENCENFGENSQLLAEFRRQANNKSRINIKVLKLHCT